MLITKDGVNVGVKCDLCNMPMMDQFTYYSFDGEMVEVSAAIKKILKGEKEHSFDSCQKCYDSLIEKVQLALQKAPPGQFVDDLTGKPLVGNYKFVRYIISKCDVNIRDEDDPQNITRNILDINIAKDSNDSLRS